MVPIIGSRPNILAKNNRSTINNPSFIESEIHGFLSKQIIEKVKKDDFTAAVPLSAIKRSNKIRLYWALLDKSLDC